MQLVTRATFLAFASSYSFLTLTMRSSRPWADRKKTGRSVVLKMLSISIIQQRQLGLLPVHGAERFL